MFLDSHGLGFRAGLFKRWSPGLDVAPGYIYVALKGIKLKLFFHSAQELE